MQLKWHYSGSESNIKSENLKHDIELTNAKKQEQYFNQGFHLELSTMRTMQRIPWILHGLFCRYASYKNQSHWEGLKCQFFKPIIVEYHEMFWNYVFIHAKRIHKYVIVTLT